jgi:glutamate/tyrosine decarboxylase-like PLP-dependent enzyme
VDRACTLARRFADRLALLDSIEVVNEAVLNQVLVRVGDEETANRIERCVQDEGTLWLGATTWRGERLLRIAVSNWSTTEEEVDRWVEAIAPARTAVTREARGIAGTKRRRGQATNLRNAPGASAGEVDPHACRLLKELFMVDRAPGPSCRCRR